MMKNYSQVVFVFMFMITINILSAQNSNQLTHLSSLKKAKKLVPSKGLYKTGIIKISSNDLKLGNTVQIINSKLGLTDEYTFVVNKLKTTVDKLGNTHKRMQQMFNGQVVEFGEIIAHYDANNILTHINGGIYKINTIVNSNSKSANQSLKSALNELKILKPMWEDEANSKFANYSKPSGDLVIIADYSDNSIFRYAWKFDVFAAAPQNYRAIVYVDAETGEILLENAIIKHANNNGHEAKGVNFNISKSSKSLFAPNEAETKYSGTRAVNTLQNGTDFTLFAQPNGTTQIVTFDANNAPVNDASQATLITDPNNDNFWEASEFTGVAQGELDAQWGAEQVYDYWLNVHGRDSYDGNGTQLNSLVHVDNNLANAFWNGSYMQYGDGDGATFDILTALDVCAHEIGHGIITSSCDLAYQRESGALNEGYADIWGAIVEHRSKGTGTNANPDNNVWIIGEDFSGSGIRSLSNPNLGNQPDTYGGTNWIDPNCANPTQANDYCGVHTNSGVINYWFYLTVAGGSGTNDLGDPFNVTGIGMTDADLIVARTVIDYLGQNSNFADARTLSIQSAVELFGECSQQVESVTNAFYAVGVGPAYTEPATCQGATINFAQTSASQTEGSDCTFTDYTVDLTIGTGATQNALVSFSVTGGTATNNVDYELLTNSVTFSQSSTASQIMTLRVFNDSFNEGNETVVINFTVNANGGDATAGDDTLTLTITDDDVLSDNITPSNVLIDENFDNPTDWGTLDNDPYATVAYDNWISLGDSGFGNTVGASVASGSNELYLGGGFTYCNPDNFIVSPEFIISGSATNVSFSLTIGGFASAEPYEIYFTTNPTTVAGITGGTLLTSDTSMADATEDIVLNNTTLAGQTGHFVVRHLQPGNTLGVLIFDTVNITETVPVGIQTSVNEGTTNDQVNLNTTGTLTSTDNGSAFLMADLVSNSDFDYGCTSIAVASAGTGGQNYNGSTVTDKTFRITPTNTKTDGSSTISFFLTEAEIAGWEAAASDDRSNLGVLKSNGSTDELATATITSFGTSGHKVTATFNTGISGLYYFGSSSSLSVNDDAFVENSFVVYPNPSSGVVKFNISTQEDVSVSVLDIRGRQVYSKNYKNNTNRVSSTLNLENLSNGVYVFQLTTAGKTMYKKLVIN
jgi:Zn-dependent metalloprotease